MDDEFLAVLAQNSLALAPRLLGCELVRQLDGQILRARIVETEAYDQADEASHSYRGRTARTEAMFGPAGHAYIYFTYGMHYCLNVVCDEEGHGAGVLIRAAEPLAGIDIMHNHRGGKTGVQLTNGPGKLAQALAINRELYGHNLQQPPLQLVLRPPLAASDIEQTARIGIKHAREKLWRFSIRDNSYVSRR
jgi:DNA-3-methyladenine glycosylase